MEGTKKYKKIQREREKKRERNTERSDGHSGGRGVITMLDYEDDDEMESEGEEEEEEEDIPVLGELELEHTVRLSSWSPTMDVFVVAYETETEREREEEGGGGGGGGKPNNNNKLELFHMNLRRLWTVETESRPTALAWRPDGCSLAVGYENGTVALVETETGEAAVSLSLRHAAPVCLLYWHDASDWIQSQSSSSPSEGDKQSRVDSSSLTSSSGGGGGGGFSLLCSCDRNLNLQVSAHGLLPLVKVDVRAQLCATGSGVELGTRVNPLVISANGDFTRLLVAFCSYDSGAASSSSDGKGGLIFKSLLLDVSPVSAMKADIWHWADYILALEKFVSKLRATRKSLRPQVAHLNQNYPCISSEEDGRGGGGAKYQMSRSKLSKSLLLGYSAVANSMIAQKSCKSVAVELDKSMAKLYQILTYSFLPDLESLYQHLLGYSSKSTLWNTNNGSGGGNGGGGGEEKNVLRQILKHVVGAIKLAQALQPSMRACSRQAREYFSWLHGSQLSLDKEELPHSQIKALLQSNSICGALCSQEGEGKGEEENRYLDWRELSKTLDDFQEEVISICSLSDTMQLEKQFVTDLVSVDESAVGEGPIEAFVDLVVEDEEEGEGEGEGGEKDYWNVMLYKKSSRSGQLCNVSSFGLTGVKHLDFGQGQEIASIDGQWAVVRSEDKENTVLEAFEFGGAFLNRNLRAKSLGDVRVDSFAVSKSRATAYVQDSDKNVTVFDLE